MVIMSILVVAVFIWLVFNHPFKGEKVEDTYEYFMRKVEKKDREGGI